MPLSETVNTRLQALVESHEIVLFMKGNRSMPRCGFSATVVGLLDEAIDDYKTVDVLEDAEVREGIKEFSNWPTIPQLYVKGEFQGGCDIVRDMFASGDLHKKLGVEQPERVVPEITISDSAAAALNEAASQADPRQPHLRLEVTSSFRHDLHFGAAKPTDIEIVANGVTLLVDGNSGARANGLSLDFIDQHGQAGFKLDNPNAPASVQQMDVRELRKLIDGKEDMLLLDVRTEHERDNGRIDGDRPLDDAATDDIEARTKDTRLVFYCQHGARSQAAAEHFLRQGYTNVWNLAGGIEAWQGVQA